MMKKYLLMFGALFLMGLGLTACSSDDEHKSDAEEDLYIQGLLKTRAAVVDKSELPGDIQSFVDKCGNMPLGIYRRVYNGKNYYWFDSPMNSSFYVYTWDSEGKLLSEDYDEKGLRYCPEEGISAEEFEAIFPNFYIYGYDIDVEDIYELIYAVPNVEKYREYYTTLK